MEASTESAVLMGSIPGVASTSIEVATLRKLRMRLLPFLLALYVIALSATLALLLPRKAQATANAGRDSSAASDAGAGV